ncbi:MAG TPA: glycosyltransferase family 87 protein [Bryobacteraceae bacterium]|nr:glycosyltransferase family 87 protein [Bryobacteraceae bacterium]
MFRIVGAFAAAGLLAQMIAMVWARHEFGPVESMIALQAGMFQHGRGLYHDFRDYPFLVTPYGPVFYVLIVGLHALNIPWFQSERMVSLAALLATFWIAWRILAYLISDRRAQVAGFLLVLASASLCVWGTMGQTDMLAVGLSMGAFLSFLRWRDRRTAASLIAAGALTILAVFTKQTAVSAGCAIGVCLVLEDRKRGALWISAIAATGAAIALELNRITYGNFFSNAILANINPYAGWKFYAQVKASVLFGFGLWIVAAAGLGSRNLKGCSVCLPLYIYTAFATTVWLATSPKVGSEPNYQIETLLLLALCAACSLDRLQFFDRLEAGDTSWITLLQIPLLLHIVLNIGLTFEMVAGRVECERLLRKETAILTPILASRPGRLLTWQYDIVVQSGKPLELDVWFYTLLANAGRVDSKQVLEDLAQRRFRTIILGMNVFDGSGSKWRNGETLFLPDTHLNVIRKYYRLVAHVPGPYLGGDYVYEPGP